MNIIKTRLVKDGNSVAVRIPKAVLAMSGLHDVIEMEVDDGQITLRPAQSFRDSWTVQIMKVLAAHSAGIPVDEELDDWEITSSDGLGESYSAI